MPHRRVQFWRPDAPSVAYMVRVDDEDRERVSYASFFHAVVLLAGAFDGWYRGAVRAYVPGALKLKEPGEVHRQVRVHAPFTLEAVSFTEPAVRGVADALGLRGSLRFRAAVFGPTSREARLAAAMRRALVEHGGSVLERETRVTETLGSLLEGDARAGAPRAERRAPLPVRRARSYLHDGLTERVTLDALALHAGLDKFHLVRAFKAEVGLPPYEYLTHARVARACELLRSGVRGAEVAQAVGFYDESQLHRHFRRIVGIAPGAFARSFRTGQHRPSRAEPFGAISGA